MELTTTARSKLKFPNSKSRETKKKSQTKVQEQNVELIHNIGTKIKI